VLGGRRGRVRNSFPKKEGGGVVKSTTMLSGEKWGRGKRGKDLGTNE